MKPDPGSPEFQDAAQAAAHKITDLVYELGQLPGQDTRTVLAGLLAATAGVALCFKPADLAGDDALDKAGDNIRYYGAQFISMGLDKAFEKFTGTGGLS